MQLAVEVPIPELKNFEDVVDFDFCLAHLCEDKSYKQYFKDRAAMGRMVFLDNSVWELSHPLSQGQLIKLGKEIGATHIVSPDILDDCRRTVANAEEFIQDVSFCTPVGVVQGQTNDERIECYTALVLLGYRFISFPLTPLLPQIEREEERVKLFKTLRSRRLHSPNVKYHLMTLDVVATLWTYANYGVAYVDTRLPIHCARQGKLLTEATVRPPKQPLDLTKPFSDEIRLMAIENVRRLAELCAKTRKKNGNKK